jgi:hypothetical protein
MNKRLHVRLTDTEYQEIQRAARSCNMSVADWFRQALGIVRRKGPSGSIAKKLEALRAAARFEFPTADIDAMLTEIENGYRAETNP